MSLRWAPEVLLALAEGPRRFNALLNSGALEGISDRILTERLRDLEDLGLAARHVEAGPPVRVTYRLTEAALPYIPPLRQLASLSQQEVDSQAV